jgi:ADP-L-glycero-D-manno-heptose 6-epimerase
MIIVTGGLGFIGSNIIHALNAKGITDIMLVDDFTDGTKFINVADARINDFCDKDDFMASVTGGSPGDQKIEAIIHQGACSSTTEWNGKLVMDNNYSYSKALLHFAERFRIPLIYASSASVYGGGTTFLEDERFENPLNVYAYSKLLFDQYVRRRLSANNNQVVGLRYFNVYGPREQHKGRMASVAFHLRNQLLADGVVQLFSGFDGYKAGEQRRDFIYVDDVVDVILWFLDNPSVSGIFNVGTGKSQSFNEVARTVLDTFSHGELQYITFPENLVGKYQSFTEADITRLRSAGYAGNFRPVEAGVVDYMQWLERYCD